LSLLLGVVVVEAEERCGWWIGEVVSGSGVSYLAGSPPAVEF
jgi:hypothetical protein